MPLNEKGQKIMEGMKSQYGPEKGEEVFYASKNKGTITGVDSRDAAGVIPMSYVPERQNLIGNVPTEEGGFNPASSKPDEKNTPTSAPISGLANSGNTVVGSLDPPKERTVIPSIGDHLPITDGKDSHPVGDQSMANWNARNKAFYGKRMR